LCSPRSAADVLEAEFAAASPHRPQQRAHVPDGSLVPLLIPEINARSSELARRTAEVELERRDRHPSTARPLFYGDGARTAQPFGINKVAVTTMQAVSGRDIRRRVARHPRESDSIIGGGEEEKSRAKR
jgi:aspartate-semialdehyde dehydrogenase